MTKTSDPYEAFRRVLLSQRCQYLERLQAIEEDLQSIAAELTEDEQNHAPDLESSPMPGNILQARAAVLKAVLCLPAERVVLPVRPLAVGE